MVSIPTPAPTIVGKEIPASGKEGSLVPVGVEVAVSVGVDVGLAVEVGVLVGLPVGDVVGLGDGLSPVRLNARALQDSIFGSAAAGSLVGAVGATGSCLNW